MTELIILDIILVAALVVAIAGLAVLGRQAKSRNFELMKAQNDVAAWELAMNFFPAFTVFHEDRGWQVAVLDEEGQVLTKARHEPHPTTGILKCEAQLRKDNWPHTNIVSAQATLHAASGVSAGGKAPEPQPEDDDPAMGTGTVE